MEASITDSTRLRKSPKIAWQIIEDETAIVTLHDTTLHILNSTGTRIWQLLDVKKSIAELVDAICEEYDVTRERAEKSIRRFVKELVLRGILEIEK